MMAKKQSTRPHVICHMVATIDGRIDGSALRDVIDGRLYEATGELLDGDAWICGRLTMQKLAEKEPFVSKSNTPAGAQPVHVARRADSYAVSVDTMGKLQWTSGDLDGDHLICIVSERAPADYLAMLRERSISYIVAGAQDVDLQRAVELLGERFGIRRLLLEGGGHINGGFLQAGLVDEVSLLLAPAVDGRHDVSTVFDGISGGKPAAVALELQSVERREDGVLWIRYDVVRT